MSQAQEPERGKDPSIVRIELLLDRNPTSNEAIALVRDDLRDATRRDALHAAAPPGTRAVVGGYTAIYADVNSANKSSGVSPRAPYRPYQLVQPLHYAPLSSLRAPSGRRFQRRSW